MLPLGTELPSFKLPDTTSAEFKLVTANEVSGQLVLVGFICNHCPFVIHIIEQLAQSLKQYQKNHVGCVLISSNDVLSYPQDGPDKMTEFAKKYDISVPYLYDESQAVAQAFQAACTPEFYLFDQERKLVYRGQFDASRPATDIEVTGEDLDQAIELALQGKQLAEQQPSIGCNIKWKS